MDCEVTQWTQWTAPDEGGNRRRSRAILDAPLNGGKSCPPLADNDKGKKKNNYLNKSVDLYSK